MENTIKVLVVKPCEEPHELDIENSLKALQTLVGGYIECMHPFLDDVALVCNEEGKLLMLDANRVILSGFGDHYDVVHGTFILVGVKNDGFTSLTPEQSVKYKALWSLDAK